MAVERGPGWQAWFKDMFLELLLLAAVFALLWHAQTKDFNVCDAQLKSGFSGSDQALKEKVASDHLWGANCKSQNKLHTEGFTREKCSQCLDQALTQYFRMGVAIMATALSIVVAVSIRDFTLWRSPPEVTAGTTKCHQMATNPITLVAFLGLLAVSIVQLWQCIVGFTCSLNSSAQPGWVHVVFASPFAVHNLLVVITLLVLRLGALTYYTIQSMISGEPVFILYKTPALTKAQVQAAYGVAAEHQSLLPPTSTSQSKMQNSIRPWVQDFYRKFNPDKMDQVEGILNHYTGHEESLYKDLQQKYAVPQGAATPNTNARVAPSDMRNSTERNSTNQV